jgi:hypothetical protein
MKLSRLDVHGKAIDSLLLKFEAQHLTSFSGLIIFQRFFSMLQLKTRLWRCFRHLKVSALYGHHVIMMVLVVHLLLGYRELRDVRYYRDDEMVKRLLGLKRLPDVATISRGLANADETSVEKVREMSKRMVLERVAALALARVTLDFDGSVQSTGRHAEGTAVGFNKKKKGARSYYPLLCTVAQTDQVLDVHHRPGNVHDSNGAKPFIHRCFSDLRAALPTVRAETRMDSAFFNEAIVDGLHTERIEFTLSVPFERFTELKGIIEGRRRWHRLNAELDYFESRWKPKCWGRRYRFVFIRKRVKRQHKEPIQLDLFIPIEHDHEFKVIVTNKRLSARKVVVFHEGRGSQEGLIGELKSHCQMDYVPVTTRVGNQLYLLAAVLAHNLTRELHMQVDPQARGTTEKRAPLWRFRELDTLRRTLIQRAGRIIRPGGKPTLSMNTNVVVQDELLHYLGGLNNGAA